MLLIIIAFSAVLSDSSWCFGKVNQEEMQMLLSVFLLGIADAILTGSLVYLLIK